MEGCSNSWLDRILFSGSAIVVVRTKTGNCLADFWRVPVLDPVLHFFEVCLAWTNGPTAPHGSGIEREFPGLWTLAHGFVVVLSTKQALIVEHVACVSDPIGGEHLRALWASLSLDEEDFTLVWPSGDGTHDFSVPATTTAAAAIGDLGVEFEYFILVVLGLGAEVCEATSNGDATEDSTGTCLSLVIPGLVMRSLVSWVYVVVLDHVQRMVPLVTDLELAGHLIQLGQ